MRIDACYEKCVLRDRRGMFDVVSPIGLRFPRCRRDRLDCSAGNPVYNGSPMAVQGERSVFSGDRKRDCGPNAQAGEAARRPKRREAGSGNRRKMAMHPHRMRRRFTHPTRGRCSMRCCIYLPGMLLAAWLWAGASGPLEADDEAATVAAVRASAEQLTKNFNAGKSQELAALFHPQGEYIDEQGVVTQGRAALAELFGRFFEKFPQAVLAVEIESVRPIGSSLAIEEGLRQIESSSGGGKAQFRYSAVRVLEGGKWLIASLRETADDPAPTPHDRLEPLSWLVGDWINEGDDTVVKLHYAWSEDGNFLLGDFQIAPAGKPASKSSQRIGWDPLTGKVHSWLFDADSGYSEGQWTAVDDGWLVKSSSVNPDGEASTATLTWTKTDKDHFTIKGTDRIVGDARARL